MKRFRNTIILSMLLALTLCVGAQATENTMLKVGLKYGSDALFTARLQNYNDTLSGSGYEFGYYDADRSFVPLAVTDEQKITVTVDSNAYVSGGVCYETRPPNYPTTLSCSRRSAATRRRLRWRRATRRASSPTSTGRIVCASATTRATMSPRACCRKQMCWPMARRS